MDYCPGGNLGNIIKFNDGLTEEISRLYLAEIILAIEAIHKRSIVYRDLKPENIMIAEDGHIKLIDFGLSKDGIRNNHETSTFCGSKQYLAPEVLRRTSYGRSLDWYLLGIVFYEMIEN